MKNINSSTFIRCPKYSQYLKTDIPWIDSIPAHWDIVPLSTQLREINNLNIGNVESNVLSLSYGEIIRRDVSGNFGLLPESFQTYQIVNPGDLILRLTDLQNDQRSLRVGYVHERGIITSAYLGLRNIGKYQNQYAFYILHSYDLLKVFYGFGGGVRQSMRYQDLKRLPLLAPPLDEQRAIANFLDHKTATIDRLIAKKRELIERLQEKRTALISHAVTKGLDPSVPMRDSGVEWLGEIPAHWEIKRVKHLFVSLDNKRVPLSAEARGTRQGIYPYYGASGIIDWIDDYLFDEPLVLVCEDGWNLYLRSHPVARIVDGKIWVNNHAHVLRPLENNTIFFAYALELTPFWIYSTGMRQPKLTADSLKEIPLAFPTQDDEVRGIESYISEKIIQYNKLTSSVTEAINRLQEYRTALISTAVTGKIDVREYEPESDSSRADH